MSRVDKYYNTHLYTKLWTWINIDPVLFCIDLVLFSVDFVLVCIDP